MKIRESLNNPAGIPEMAVRDDLKTSRSRGAEFHEHLVKAEDGNYEQHIERLVNDIIRQGETLAKRIDVRELMNYKRLISEFLDTALGNSKKFSRQSLLDRRGRHKVYAIIKNINKELDQLTQDVINGEKDNINILKRLDDIRGLILDILA